MNHQVQIDAVVSGLREVFQRACRAGETTFLVDTKDHGRVTVTISMENDRLAFSVMDPDGKPLAASYAAHPVGQWLVVLNEVRKYRPRGTPPPGTNCNFGCAITPDQSRSPLWITNRSMAEVQGLEIAIVSQGFPAVDQPTALLFPYQAGHFVHRENRLTKTDLAAFVTIARSSPGLLVYFNFLEKAGMTVGEHLHGQAKIQPGQLPIQRAYAAMAADPRECAVIRGYPALAVGVDSSSERLWPMIDRLQRANQAFNLALLRNHAFVAARTKFISSAFPGVGMAALETLASTLIVEDRHLVQEHGVYVWEDPRLLRKTAEKIDRAMGDVTLPEEEIRKFMD